MSDSAAAAGVDIVPGRPTQAWGRILDAAEALFAERGYNGVSMNAVATRADVSKANVFHHFRSKNELYLEVFRRACRESTALLEAMDTDEGPFPDRLKRFAAGHLENLLANERTSRLILAELLAGRPRTGQQLAEEVFGDNFARLVGILRDGQRRGELRPDVEPAMVAMALAAANLFFFQSRQVLRHLPDVPFADDPNRYSAMLVDLLLNGTTPCQPDTPDPGGAKEGV